MRSVYPEVSRYAALTAANLAGIPTLSNSRSQIHLYFADDLSKQDHIGSHEPLMSCLCDLLTSADVDTTRYVTGTLAKLCFRCVNNQVAVVERHGGLLGLLSLCECADTESRHNAAAVIVQLARQPSLKEYAYNSAIIFAFH